MGEEERARQGVIKLAAVVALKPHQRLYTCPHAASRPQRQVLAHGDQLEDASALPHL